MTSCEITLCGKLLKEYFGPLCSEIGIFIIKNGPSSLKTIFNGSKFTPNEVRKVLCVLIQHNICHEFEGSQKIMDYDIDVRSVFNTLQYSRYVYCAKKIFGDEAELLTEELLKHGQVETAKLMKNVTDRLNEFYEGEKSLTLNQVRDKMVDLSKTHFIKQTIEETEIKLNEKGEQEKVTKPNFTVPEISEMKKRKPTENVSSGKPHKRARVESDEEESKNETPDMKSDVRWNINHARFDLYIRDQIIIKAVSRKLGLVTGEIVRTILNISEVRTDPSAFATVSVSKLELFQTLPKELNVNMTCLEQYLTILEEDSMNIIHKTDESQGGMYSLLIKSAISHILQAHVESVVQERFGSKSLRVFKLLLIKKQMEQKQIEDAVMLSAKETKMILYRMFGESFVALTEVSKGSETGSRSFFLFSVNMEMLARLLLQRSYKAMANLMIRRDFERNENKRILEKQQRVEAILLQLESAGASQDQKDEIEEMITPLEKKQLNIVKHKTNKLEQSEIQLSETIFILQMFLIFSATTPVLKKSRSIAIT